MLRIVQSKPPAPSGDEVILALLVIRMRIRSAWWMMHCRCVL